MPRVSSNIQDLEPLNMFENISISDNSPTTWKMEYNIPRTPFDTPQSTNYPVSMTSVKVPQDRKPAIQLQDASTFEGQQLGAILAVKRAPRVTSFSPPFAKVGDYVEVVAHYNVSQVEVKSIRTGMIATIDWEDLLPVPYDGKCGCLNGGCRCVYETWQAYSTRRPLPVPQISRPIPVDDGQNMSEMNGMDFDFPTMEELGQVNDVFTNTYSPIVPMSLQIPVPSNQPIQHSDIGTNLPPIICDPLTVAGQTPGAILAVRHFAFTLAISVLSSKPKLATVANT